MGLDHEGQDCAINKAERGATMRDSRRDGHHKMGLDGVYRKTVPLNVHLIKSNAGRKGVTAGETAPQTLNDHDLSLLSS